MDTDVRTASEGPLRRVGGYIRVSRIGGRAGDSYISVDIQKERITTYAADRGWEVAEWFKDEDYSGGNTDRPRFLELIEECRAGTLEGVVVAALDRFSRDVTDGVGLAQQILKAGAIFGSVREAMDYRDDIGFYMLVQFFNNAHLQLAQIKTGWETAKVKAVARGVFIGPTPLGYLRTPKGSPIGSGMLVIDPDKAPVVRRCFELRYDGDSYVDIAKYLDRALPRPNGWSAQYAKKMLMRRVYRGEVHYRAKAAGRLPLVNLHAHEPIVPADLFAGVQDLHTIGSRRVARVPFLLSGIVRCAHCRYAMCGFAYSGTHRDTRVYRCTGRKRCPVRPIVLAAPLEEYVTGEFWRLTNLPPEVENVVSAADLATVDHDVHQAEAHMQRLLRQQHVLEEDDWEIAVSEAATVQRAARLAKKIAYDRLERDAARRPVVPTTDEQLHDLLIGSIRHVLVWKVKRGTDSAGRCEILSYDDEPILIPSRSEGGPFTPLDKAEVHAGISQVQAA